jgi:opacity protein-like surface antigen
MRKAFIAALFVVACAAVSFGQGTEYQKGEIYVGYSANFIDTDGAFSTNPNDERDRFDGVNVAGAANISRYFGLKADFSHHRKDGRFTVGTTTTDVRARLTQFMGGVKVQDNALETRFRPFAHALVGVAHASADLNTGTVSASDSDNGLALAFGGGLDIRVHKNVDIRAIQLDYNPNRFNGETDNNIRVGVGVNFRF